MKKILNFGIGLVALITGILVLVFKGNFAQYTAMTLGFAIVFLSLYKFAYNVKYATNKNLRAITIAELALVVVLGIYTVYQTVEGSNVYINISIGLAMYITALSYLWQSHHRTNYTMRNRTFFGNIILITLGSNIMLSKLDIAKLTLNLSIGLIIYGSLVLIYNAYLRYYKK